MYYIELLFERSDFNFVFWLVYSQN